MVMTRIMATPSPTRAAAMGVSGGRGIALYNVGGLELAGLGHHLRDAARRLPHSPSTRAWDFLSIALAVFGADRFLSRRDAADGWTRMIALEVELAEPEPWEEQAAPLAAALRFLTGDIWHLRFRGGGARPPIIQASLTDRDCACLFSGGLDSLIGAADLLAAGRRPLLVSQASPKEGPIQAYLACQLGLAGHRFEGRVIERAAPPYEPSSRSRSILFIAYGVLAATSIEARRKDAGLAELFVPENGLIAVNPPLTRRRLGSLSTRTTHPHFLSSLQAVFDEAGISVRMVNPYRGKTKGEMLLECQSPAAIRSVGASYSCGKGKRLNKHCGRCVPCLIRRAAFHRAGFPDATVYAADDLARHARYDDVFAARLATAELGGREVARWAAESGPLPEDPAERDLHVEAVRRGLSEVSDFLATVHWP